MSEIKRRRKTLRANGFLTRGSPLVKRGSVREWWFHTCLECIGIVDSAVMIPGVVPGKGNIF